MDNYKLLDNIGLEELVKLIYHLDSEAEGIEIINSEGHRFFKVRIDSETIILDSEGDLSVNVDFETILFNSEGKLSARSVREGEAIEITTSEGEQVINVKYDDNSIHLNSEGQLVVIPAGDKAIEITSEGKVATKIDDYTIKFDSEGRLVARSLQEGEANHIYDSSEGEQIIDVLYDDVTIHLNSENELELHLDSDRAIDVDSEGKIFIKVDDLSIKFDSEGRLYAIPEPLFDGVATKVNPKTSAYDSESIDVLYNKEAGLMVNSENELEVKIVEPLHFDSEGKIELLIDDTLKVENGELGADLDLETLVLNSEGKIIVPIDKRTLVMENGQLIVPVDDSTIRVNSEGKLEADSLPKPLLPETFLHVNSELVVEWREQRLNDQEFIGDLNTETAKIIWYGTSEEYAQLVANSELYDYTLYVVNDGAPIIAQDFDYNKLENKPEINGVTLSGNKSLADFGIQPVLNSGIAVNINNNKTDLQYLPGVLGVDSSNRLYANTYTAEQIDNMLASLRTIKYAATKPATGVRNTLYYVGSSAPYEMYLYDSYGAEIYLGTSDVRTYSAGEGININSSNVISADLDTLIQQGSTSTKAPTSAAVAAYAEAKDNKVTSISAASTNDEYPSAKLLYDQLATKIGSVAPSDNSLEVLGGTTITHKAPTDLGGAGTIGSATVIPKITYDRFGHIQKAEGLTAYPPTSPGLNGQLWVSDGVEAGTWAALSSLVRIKYQTGEQTNVTDSTTIVVSAPAADTGYARIGCVGAYISSTVPGVNWAVTNMTDSQVTLYANGWSGTQTITANTVWLYVRSNG